MDTDSNDSIPKSSYMDPGAVCPQPGLSSSFMSPVSLQLQRHLLSSTLLASSDSPRPKQHYMDSSLRRGQHGRTESCSPTPALPYCLPTPSPTPFNSLSSSPPLPDINLSLATDPKAIHFSSTHGINSSYDDIDLHNVNRAKQSGMDNSNLDSTGQLATTGCLGSSNMQASEIIASLPKLPLMEMSGNLANNVSSETHLDISLANTMIPMNSSLRTKKLTQLENMKLIQPLQQEVMDVRLVQQEVPRNDRLLTLSVTGNPVQLVASCPPPLQTLQQVQLVPRTEEQLHIMTSISNSSNPREHLRLVTTLPNYTAPGDQLRLVSTLPCNPQPHIGTTLSNASHLGEQLHLVTSPNRNSPGDQLQLVSTLPCNPQPQLTNLSSIAPHLATLTSISQQEPGARGIPVTLMQPEPPKHQFDSHLTMVHPKKKRRLLTFLTEQQHQQQECKSEQQTLIINPMVSQPTLIAPVSTATEALLTVPSSHYIPTQSSNASRQLLPLDTTLEVHHPGNSIPSIGQGSQSLVLELPTDVSGLGDEGISQQRSMTNNGASILTYNDTAQGSLLLELPPHHSVDSIQNIGNEDGTQERSLPPNGTSLITYCERTDNTQRNLVVDNLNTAFPCNLEPLDLQLPATLSRQCSFATISNQEKINKKDKYMEHVECYKCRFCGFLSLNKPNVEMHISDEHEDDLSDVEEERDKIWLSVALKEGIKLTCPLCPNLFNTDRSFKVHIVEDHEITENEAENHLRIMNQSRKKKALEIIKNNKEREREEKRKNRTEGILEAYVDNCGELRIRTTKRYDESQKSETISNIKDEKQVNIKEEDEEIIDVLKESSDEECEISNVDMSVSEYAAALGKLENITKKSKIRNKEKLKKKQLQSIGEANNISEREKSIKIKNKGNRQRVGRPRGSRTLGITALRKLNPQIRLNDTDLGTLCGIDGCAVRMKSESNLKLHRTMHVDRHYRCPQCQVDIATWMKVSLHMWRQHVIDMELLKCNSCEFRCFNEAKLKLHNKKHSEERPFLCPECGRAFKLRKQLKIHTAIHDKREDGDESKPARRTFSCNVCGRKFGELRMLRHHVETVHEKLKPYLCNFCGYAASSKSTLRLHMRVHTGDKPYKCDDCEYSTGDHNSLRRHKMRHSGMKPYKCPYCPYASIQSTTYKIHLKNKHPGQSSSSLVFHCQSCMYKTVKEANFLAHLTEHSGTHQTKDDSAGIIQNNQESVVMSYGKHMEIRDDMNKKAFDPPMTTQDCHLMQPLDAISQSTVIQQISQNIQLVSHPEQTTDRNAQPTILSQPLERIVHPPLIQPMAKKAKVLPATQNPNSQRPKLLPASQLNKAPIQVKAVTVAQKNNSIAEHLKGTARPVAKKTEVLPAKIEPKPLQIMPKNITNHDTQVTEKLDVISEKVGVNEFFV